MLFRYLKKLNQACTTETEISKSQYLTFAMYGLINTIIPYLLWSYNLKDQLTIILQVMGSIFCFLLLFFQDWKPAFKEYFPVYWYLSLLYCLPFLSTYMLLNNTFSIGWTINSILSLFLLSMLTDWLRFLILLGVGIISGWLTYLIYNGYIDKGFWDNNNHIFLGYTYLSSVIIGGFFARKKDIYTREKEEYLKLLSSSIAHELRTPLLSISMGLKAIKEEFHIFLDTRCPEHKVVFQMSDTGQKTFQKINYILNNMEKINNESFTIIDMFLIKTKANINREETNKFSMQYCIKRALEEYPLTEYEKKLIVWDKEEDFYFKGNEILIVHVLFNLLKNSIYCIKEVNKGKIYISLFSMKNLNVLVFKDTGKGISKESINHIFQKFYSRTKYGTGIGLSFCKMVMEALGGEIRCKSQEGKFTEFRLYFPKC